MEGRGQAEPLLSLGEAQAFVRVETGEEEALLAGLIRTASALGEDFLNQVVIARDFFLTVSLANAAWHRLSIGPIRAVTLVERMEGDGSATAMPVDAYAIDLDSNGDGWIRLTQAPTQRVRVRVHGKAGLATDRNDVPEPIRQGVARLVAHLYAARDGTSDAPPAAVTALWRPYRRMRLS